MNKTLNQIGAIFVASIISTATLAQNPYPVQNAIVLDHYKNVIQQEPYDVEVCKQVRQNTGSGDGSATNEIIGAIFGGAIGNQFGEGDGKDAMTLAGMFLGASLAHDDEIANNQTGGYTTRTKCYIERRYDESRRKVYSHSTLTFKIKGKKYRVDFTK